jgi:hypothetical protein
VAGQHPDQAGHAGRGIADPTGQRLFDEGEPPIPLTLISSQTFQTGVLNLVYAAAESAGDAGYEDAKVHLSRPEQ